MSRVTSIMSNYMASYAFTAEFTMFKNISYHLSNACATALLVYLLLLFFSNLIKVENNF